MPNILILYYSKTGNTMKMAEAIGEGVIEAGGTVEVLNVKDVDDPVKLKEYNGIIMGSPTYFGMLATPLKEFIDQSIKVYTQLEGKVGGAFSSCGVEGGGSETTNLSIIQSLLVHGMIIPGFSKMGHYGPVSTGSPDKRCLEECKKLGEKVTKLAEQLHQ